MSAIIPAPSDQSSTFNISIFEVVNQKVNLTKICQSFDKDIRKWTRQEGIKALISALEEAEPNVAHLEIINGVGTFGTREVAIELTRWISPKFAVWANKQIDTLLQTGSVSLSKPKSITELARENMALTAKLLDELEAKELELAKKDLTISHQNDTVQAIIYGKASLSRTMLRAVKNDIGVEINRLVDRLYGHIHDYAERHRTARAEFATDTGIYYTGAKTASLETKKEYLDWLRRQGQKEYHLERVN